MRILFVTWGYPPGPVGGAERQAQRQAHELAARGHRVTVVCRQEGPGLVSNDWDGAVRLVRVRRSGGRPVGKASYLLRLGWVLLRQARRHDLVHVHLANLQADVAAIACTLARRPLWVKIACGGAAGEVQRLSRAAWATRWFGLRHADCVQAISEEIFTEVTGPPRVPVDRIARIPNGIDLTSRAAPPDKAAARRRLGLPADALLFMFLGRLSAYKGLDTLMAAWTAAKLPAQLLVVGPEAPDAPIPPGLLSGPGVLLLGPTERSGDYLCAADVLVAPSRSEGMSNVVMEALAYGVPVIATTVGANPTLLGHGSAGVLVPPDDPPALAHALRRLATDDAARRRLSRAGREQVASLDLATVVDQIEARYQDLLAARLGGPLANGARGVR